MKKVLAVLGCLALVAGSCAVLVVGGLIAGNKMASQRQKDFYDLVYSGDAKRFLAACDQNLASELDEPVVAEWMKAVKERLGAYKQLEALTFAYNVKSENGVTTEESKGTIDFEKGPAESRVTYVNGKLAGFEVKSKLLEEGAFPVQLGSTELYEKRGEEFLKKLFAGDAEAAHAMMHENLRKAIPLDKFKEQVASVREATGALKNMAFATRVQKPAAGDEAFTVRCFYDVECEKGSGVASVKFERTGLRMSLLGYNVNDKKP